MSEPHRLRIGTQQREEAISALNEHFAAGRLEIAEYEQRVGAASAAQTVQDLAELFQDLPVPHPPFLPPALGYGQPTPPPFQAHQTTVLPHEPPPASFGTPIYVTPPYGVPPAVYAPYGVDPVSGAPLSDKSKMVAGVLQVLLGYFGVGRFYTGDYGIAIAQLLTCGGAGVWSFIDGIILLIGGGTDGNGRKLRD
ncbi:DUF1707 domain-containing protein [Actinosynnema pretiosum subsp. pretiosum]|uniref:Uncharacterized protein n=2 Tax=Actinosynnema TaxID=40566 RepID=C6WA62_ACTMD|nr:DUF1707 domain-containing protein [Actinosynnema mirum]ACU39251.1 protein of unknown function DUF1707 [Actinosynnema mirum DSM 43827]AXX32851.1 protein of unknown function DUF1707 [Actinosynnema pretiosum subsp. pretiosum]QUF03279.1 DUF1707 domain-containing protein [Actinosynnema pretiosum subsp. pretiosum]